MLLSLKMAILQRRIRQSRMAVDLGWDPAKLSRIVHEVSRPTADERRAIAKYLNSAESQLFVEPEACDPRTPRERSREGDVPEAAA